MISVFFRLAYENSGSPQFPYVQFSGPSLNWVTLESWFG